MMVLSLKDIKAYVHTIACKHQGITRTQAHQAHHGHQCEHQRR